MCPPLTSYFLHFQCLYSHSSVLARVVAWRCIKTITRRWTFICNCIPCIAIRLLYRRNKRFGCAPAKSGTGIHLRFSCRRISGSFASFNQSSAHSCPIYTRHRRQAVPNWFPISWTTKIWRWVGSVDQNFLLNPWSLVSKHVNICISSLLMTDELSDTILVRVL